MPILPQSRRTAKREVRVGFYTILNSFLGAEGEQMSIGTAPSHLEAKAKGIKWLGFNVPLSKKNEYN